MAPPQSLDDLNDDVICEIYERMLERDDEDGELKSQKRSLIDLACMNKRMNALAQPYLFRDIVNRKEPADFESMCEYYYMLWSKPLVTQTLRTLDVSLHPFREHGYSLQTTYVFSLIKRATGLRELSIHGQRDYLDEYDHLVENTIETTDIAGAMDALELKKLPSLRVMYTGEDIGIVLLPGCRALEKLYLDEYGHLDFGKVLKTAKVFTKLCFVQARPNCFTKEAVQVFPSRCPAVQELDLVPDLYYLEEEFFKTDLPSIVSQLHNLQKITLPDVEYCLDELHISYEFRYKAGHKTLMEVIARGLFRLQPALAAIKFWSCRDPPGWDYDEDNFDDLRDIIGVQRGPNKEVEKLLWLYMGAFTRYEVDEETYDSREGEEDVAAWARKHGDQARAFLAFVSSYL